MPKEKLIEYKGQTKSISAWIRDLGLSKSAVFSRFRMGWDVDRTFSTPISPSSWQPKQIEFRGKRQSMSAWAREIGCSLSQLSKRLKQGMSTEEALSKPFLKRPEDGKMSQLIEFKGIKRTLIEWANEIKIKPTTLYDRLHKGWDVERALTTPLGQGVKKFYLYNGKRKTIAGWSAEKGLSERLVRGRLERGWTIDRSLETPSEVKSSRSILFEGKYRSLAEISQLTGIKTGTLSTRLNNGWDIDKAVGTPVDTERSKSRTLEIRGERHTTTEWAKLYGVPSHLILQRIDHGWTVERAITEPVAERKYHDLTYKGQTHSMSDWARLLGIKFSTLSQRINSGWSVEDALTTGMHQKWHFKRKAAKPSPVRKHREKPYFYNGRQMGSAEFSAALNIPRGTLYYFLKKGLTQEQIIDRAVHGLRDENGHLVQNTSTELEGRYVYKGNRYTQKQLARLWGINKSLFVKYKARGFTIQDLINLVEREQQLPSLFSAGSGRGRGRPRKEIKVIAEINTEDQDMVEYDGESLSYHDFATRHGLTVTKVEQMLDMGMSPEEIVSVSTS